MDNDAWRHGFSLAAAPLCPVSRCLDLGSWFQLPASEDPERQWRWQKQLDSCHPCGRTGLSSQFLAYVLAEPQLLQAFG